MINGDEKKMAIVQRDIKANITESESKKDEQEILYNVYPDISLKSLPNWFHLHAKRGQLMYSANQNFGKKIIPENTTAKYENGLLTIRAKIPDPFDGAKEITF